MCSATVVRLSVAVTVILDPTRMCSAAAVRALTIVSSVAVAATHRPLTIRT